MQRIDRDEIAERLFSAFPHAVTVTYSLIWLLAATNVYL